MGVRPAWARARCGEMLNTATGIVLNMQCETKREVKSMKTPLAKTSALSPDSLICPACGHGKRFIEVMRSEVHLVDGGRNYIRLIEGVTDHYICFACGESFESGFTKQ